MIKNYIVLLLWVLDFCLHSPRIWVESDRIWSMPLSQRYPAYSRSQVVRLHLQSFYSTSVKLTLESLEQFDDLKDTGRFEGCRSAVFWAVICFLEITVQDVLGECCIVLGSLRQSSHRPRKNPPNIVQYVLELPKSRQITSWTMNRKSRIFSASPPRSTKCTHNVASSVRS